jgi:hypothetical protein
MTYTPKPPRRAILAAKVEPEIKVWLKKRFPESVSHGVNYILAEYMAKHTRGKDVKQAQEWQPIETTTTGVRL